MTFLHICSESSSVGKDGDGYSPACSFSLNNFFFFLASRSQPHTRLPSQNISQIYLPILKACCLQFTTHTYIRYSEVGTEGKLKDKRREMAKKPCCDKAHVKKGQWSVEEDRRLKTYIDQHGISCGWVTLPQRAGLQRCGKSCRLRWLNYLRPGLKRGNYSEQEDEMICRLYSVIGSRWSVMASHLQGRTDNDIKNYWNTQLKYRYHQKYNTSTSPNVDTKISMTNKCKPSKSSSQSTSSTISSQVYDMKIPHEGYGHQIASNNENSLPFKFKTASACTPSPSQSSNSVWYEDSTTMNMQETLVAPKTEDNKYEEPSSWDLSMFSSLVQGETDATNVGGFTDLLNMSIMPDDSSASLCCPSNFVLDDKFFAFDCYS